MSNENNFNDDSYNNDSFIGDVDDVNDVNDVNDVADVADVRKKRKLWIILIILAVVTATAIAVTVWAFLLRKPVPSMLAPDYAPQELEQNAEDMGDSDADKLDAPEGGGAVNLMFQDKVSIDLGNKTASLYYGNPSQSTQDVLVQIVVQDKIIAQSGRLVPGKQIKKLKLEDGASNELLPGGYKGKLVLSYYNPDTSEKAAVNTEIPVSITVAA